MTAGNVCVLRDGVLDRWSVWICSPVGKRTFLARFGEQAKALDFAMAEREKRLTAGEEVNLSLPDDCPCVERGAR